MTQTHPLPSSIRIGVHESGEKEIERLREALAVAVAALEKAKAVWFGNNQTPTQCGYLMNAHISAGLRKVASLTAVDPRGEVQP
jgi:hypothetical protein